MGQHHSSRFRLLPYGDAECAGKAFSRFKADGLELIAAAALVDPSATASLIETHINYKIVARSCSHEVARDAQRLLDAVAKVQNRVDWFLAQFRRELAIKSHLV